jgi:poly(3-hydroxybutyrate) depolymerase
MFMHGNKDPLVHIDGGPVRRDRGVAISLAQGAAFWRKLDGTSAQPAVENLPDQAHEGTSVRREIYTGGKQGTEIVVYVIEGGGHTWPDGPQYLPACFSDRKGQPQSRRHPNHLGFLQAAHSLARLWGAGALARRF